MSWEDTILPDSYSTFRREYMGQFIEEQNRVYEKALLGALMHPVKPLVVKMPPFFEEKYIDERRLFPRTNPRCSET